MDNLSSENKKGPLGTSVQVRLTAQDIIFGPGKAMLLEYIEATGSIQEACARMELSYSKGSRMIKKAEKQLGFRLLERRIGGSGGGGSRLTPEAKDLLKKYQTLVQRVREDADKAFREIFYHKKYVIKMIEETKLRLLKRDGKEIRDR